MTCASCRYSWDGKHCRKNAPTVVTGKDGPVWSGFPLLPRDSQGCGEHEHKPEETLG